ncbi:16710_t:CDS:2, partial [Entrophospora sp. SA101]
SIVLLFTAKLFPEPSLQQPNLQLAPEGHLQAVLGVQTENAPEMKDDQETQDKNRKGM